MRPVVVGVEVPGEVVVGVVVIAGVVDSVVLEVSMVVVDDAVVESVVLEVSAVVVDDVVLVIKHEQAEETAVGSMLQFSRYVGIAAGSVLTAVV